MIPAIAVGLDDLLRDADIVCVALPLNDRSAGLLGGEQLALMNSLTIIVKIGGGEVVDETALTAMLRQRRIGAAGLDVFAAEPLDLHGELLSLPNVICTPHMAGVGWENV